jgi:hypothetical protein
VVGVKSLSSGIRSFPPRPSGPDRAHFSIHRADNAVNRVRIGHPQGVPVLRISTSIQAPVKPRSTD